MNLYFSWILFQFKLSIVTINGQKQCVKSKISTSIINRIEMNNFEQNLFKWKTKMSPDSKCNTQTGEHWKLWSFVFELSKFIIERCNRHWWWVHANTCIFTTTPARVVHVRMSTLWWIQECIGQSMFENGTLDFLFYFCFY